MAKSLDVGDKCWLIGRTAAAPAEAYTNPEARVILVHRGGNRMADRFTVKLKETGEVIRRIHEDNVVRVDPANKTKRAGSASANASANSPANPGGLTLFDL
jgi:hypothetical protein